jgi:hypothetical protein
MEKIIEDVQGKRYDIVEYTFGHESTLKLVELLPVSREKPVERTEALTLDELNVFASHSLLKLIAS